MIQYETFKYYVLAILEKNEEDKEDCLGCMIHEIKYPIKHWWQRRTRGFDDSAIYNLDITFAEFMLPRLQVFKDELDECMHFPHTILIKYKQDYPMASDDKADAESYEIWKKYVETMIYALYYIKNNGIVDEEDGTIKDLDEKRCKKGMIYFSEYVEALWN